MAINEANLGRRTVLGAGVATGLAASGASGAQPVAPAPMSPAPLSSGLVAPPACPPPPGRFETLHHLDWAELAHYREANPLDAARPALERRVVFLGDSITLGWRARRPDFFTEHGFIGRGISGQTTPQLLVRFWPDVASLKPAAVHILAGTNDVAENTGPYDPTAATQNFMALAALAKANRIRVVIGATPPAAEFAWRPGRGPIAKIAALNAWLRAWADHEGHAFADYTAVLDDGAGAMRAGLALDGVHPTPEGYAVMEPVALAAVAQALARGPRRG